MSYQSCCRTSLWIFFFNLQPIRFSSMTAELKKAGTTTERNFFQFASLLSNKRKLRNTSSASSKQSLLRFHLASSAFGLFFSDTTIFQFLLKKNIRIPCNVFERIRREGSPPGHHWRLGWEQCLWRRPGHWGVGAGSSKVGSCRWEHFIKK